MSGFVGFLLDLVVAGGGGALVVWLWGPVQTKLPPRTRSGHVVLALMVPPVVYLSATTTDIAHWRPLHSHPFYAAAIAIFGLGENLFARNWSADVPSAAESNVDGREG